MPNEKLVIVEDDPDSLALLTRSLKKLGYQVTGAFSSGEDAVNGIHGLHADAILMDIVMSGPIDGIQAAELIRAKSDIPIIYLTAQDDDATIARAVGTSPFGYILKPFSPQSLNIGIQIGIYKHQMEIRLRQREALFRSLADTVPSAILILDGTTITFANNAAETITGYSVKELVGREFHELIEPEHYRKMNDWKSSCRELDCEILISAKNRTPKWINFRSVSMNPSDGSLIIASFTDITARKMSEVKFREYAKGLETEVKKKAEEIKRNENINILGQKAMMVGHDLKNPLQVFLQAVGALKDIGVSAPPETADFLRMRQYGTILQVIEDQANYMWTIISDIREFAKPITPKTEPCAVQDLIKNSAASIVFPDSVTMTYEESPNLPKVAADPLLIRRVFMNLINNAVQAMEDMPSGRLNIKAITESRHCAISISDTGKGMSKEELGKIFQPLYTTKKKGSGLGLAIVKRIAEGHGGAISVVSEPGKGTTFTVRLPISDN